MGQREDVRRSAVDQPWPGETVMVARAAFPTPMRLGVFRAGRMHGGERQGRKLELDVKVDTRWICERAATGSSVIFATKWDSRRVSQ